MAFLLPEKSIYNTRTTTGHRYKDSMGTDRNNWCMSVSGHNSHLQVRYRRDGWEWIFFKRSLLV